MQQNNQYRYQQSFISPQQQFSPFLSCTMSSLIQAKVSWSSILIIRFVIPLIIVIVGTISRYGGGLDVGQQVPHGLHQMPHGAHQTCRAPFSSHCSLLLVSSSCSCLCYCCCCCSCLWLLHTVKRHHRGYQCNNSKVLHAFH